MGAFSDAIKNIEDKIEDDIQKAKQKHIKEAYLDGIQQMLKDGFIPGDKYQKGPGTEFKPSAPSPDYNPYEPFPYPYIGEGKKKKEKKGSGFNIPLHIGKNDSPKSKDVCPRCGGRFYSPDLTQDLYACGNQDCDFGGIISGITLTIGGKDLNDPANWAGTFYDVFGMQYQPPDEDEDDGYEPLNTSKGPSWDPEPPNLDLNSFSNIMKKVQAEKAKHQAQMLEDQLKFQMNQQSMANLLYGAGAGPLQQAAQQQLIEPASQQSEYAVFLKKNGERSGSPMWMLEQVSKQPYYEQVYVTTQGDIATGAMIKKVTRFKRTNEFAIVGQLRARIWLETSE